MRVPNRTSTAWLVPAVLLLLLGASAPLAAQATGTLRGKVTDARSARPLQSVQVYIPGTGRGVLTDASGDFQMLNIPIGTHTLRAQLVGYGTAESAVSVAAGGTSVANLQMEPQALRSTGSSSPARRVRRDAAR